MISLFPKVGSLNKFVTFTLHFAALIIDENKKWHTLYMVYQYLNIHSCFLSSITELIIGSREFKDFVATLSTTIVCGLIHSKLFLFATKRKEIKDFFERLESVPQLILKDEENKHLVTEAESFGRKLVIGVFLAYNCFPFTAFIINLIIELFTDFKRRNLLYKIWIPWNDEKPWAHILTNIALAFVGLSTISIFVAMYVLEITFTLYISAYIKTLQNNLINKGIKNEEIYEHHKVIIHLIENYNELLSRDFYLETVIAPIIPCGYGLASFRYLQSKEFDQAVISCTTAIFCLMPAVISCTSGQIIINEMEKLHEATYMTKWYEEGLKIRKDLLTMMIKTTQPTAINYRIFIKFNHVVLSAVLQLIYSYFMLMINLDEQ